LLSRIIQEADGSGIFYNSWKIPISILIEKLDGFINIETTTVFPWIAPSLNNFPSSLAQEMGKLFDNFEVLWLQKKNS